MTVAITTFSRTTLATSSATLYTVAAGTAVITSIILANTTTSTATATIALDGVVLIPGVTIPANASLVYDVRQPLAATKTITGYAGTASAVTCHIGGVVVT